MALNTMRKAAGVSSRSRSSVVAFSQQPLPIDMSPVVGAKVGKWMGTPWDLLTFPARASAGALVSAPERLQTLQSDVQRIMELMQDPRPLEEKQDVLLQEVESTMLEFLEKGARLEGDVLSNIKAALPAEIASVLTDFIPESPINEPQEGPVVPIQPEGGPSNTPAIIYGASDVYAVQAGAELSEVRTAVAGLHVALDAVRNNTDISAASLLKLNLRDARDQLARRLQEAAPVGGRGASEEVVAAEREAGILLMEVDQFMNS